MKIWKPLRFFISRKTVGGRRGKSISMISRFHWVFYFEGFPWDKANFFEEIGGNVIDHTNKLKT
jgi:hypothetical protein